MLITLKGGVLFSELVLLNPTLSFLAIRTEDEDGGPNAIKKAFHKVNNRKNKFYDNRVNDVSTIYNITKILLCPTKLDETFCRVVYEAFLNKIPVIFSNTGNLNNINDNRLLKIEGFNVTDYHKIVHKLLNDQVFYNSIIKYQYEYVLQIKHQSNLDIIEKKFIEIQNNKDKHIGIFTPWCDQGLGIQSRIYKKILENIGYKVFIFATKPYIETDTNNLVKSRDEWKSHNVYRSPNKRLDISMLELDLFVKNYKIKKFIIPEIQYSKIFDIAEYLRYTHKVKSYAIPNIECIRKTELNRFDIFEKVIANNKMSYQIMAENLKNIELLGFCYDLPETICINNINTNKQIQSKINILHISGLNGAFRKRTNIIIDIFNTIYNQGFTDFTLNLFIQGNLDENKLDIHNKPFLNLKKGHLSYTEILNLYNDNHISIQISKHEGLGLGFYESCFMSTPVITLNAPPHNEIIHHKKNGWVLSCKVEKDDKPENPFTIIGQTQIEIPKLVTEILDILQDKTDINRIIKNTKKFTDNIYAMDTFKNKFNDILQH